MTTLREHYQGMKRRQDIHLSLDPRKVKPHGKCGGTAKCGCPCQWCMAEAMNKSRRR